MLNNMFSSTTSKIPNKIVYDYTLRYTLDLLGTSFVAQSLAMRSKTSTAISNAISNSKATYNWKHQPLFMKIGNWDLL